MFKKTLISLAVASSVGLTGCLSSGDEGANANPEYQITDTTIDTSIVRPVFNPNPISPTVAFPANFDLLLLLGATQSADYDFTGLTSGTDPASNAINDLAGFSTTGQFNIAFDGSLNPDTVIENQTVFLVPLNVAPATDAAPLALPSVNPASITGVDQDPDNQPNFRVEVITQDGVTNNTIRVTPLEPLLENKKYIVIVSDGVTGANGKPIEQSIAAQQLTEGPLGSENLASIRELVIALNGLGQQIISATQKDVALAYTFTTAGQSTVLKTLASPASYFEALGQKVGFTALLKAVRDNNPEANFSELTAILSEILAGNVTAENEATAAAVAEAGAIATEAAIGTAIQTAVASGNIPFPTTRPSFFYSKDQPATELATIKSLPSGNGIKAAAAAVSVSQGSIVLPYYQPIPAVSGGDALVERGWQGDTNLEAALNESLSSGTTTFEFLRDRDGTLNVNSNFPYPKIEGQVAAPVVAYFPNAAGTCEGISGVTIFQHGIGVDRSVSMLPGILLAAKTCQAVIAIDQPLHGLAGSTLGTLPGLDELTPEDVGPAFEAVPGLAYIGERHFNYTDAGGLTPISAESAADVTSGSLFINLKSLQGARDNLRQGVLDLLNLSASIDGTGSASGLTGLDITGTSDPDLAGLPVNFVGHSLGGITGTTFASLSNDPEVIAPYAALPFGKQFPELNSVVLHNTGGQVTKLVENSASLSDRILSALPPQGTSDLETFLYVFQSVLDEVDPAVYARSLGANTPQLMVTEVTGDATVPNEANVNPLESALSAPLAGTEPLMALFDLGANGGTLADSTGVNIVDINAAVPTTDAGVPAAIFFDGSNPCTGANHSTFVVPQVPSDECGGVADTSEAFAAMVELTGAVIAQGITPVTQNTAATLGASTTIENALDQNQ
ncbi:virulence factor lipase-like protein [Marinobacter pelagius]|uniref:Virulence factor lipase-like protein n=1 Tax=Marinobacter pelagius TaxID=379482 RepID=A0A366GIC7_9GAMM|nr:MECDP-synthase [Marinobacter pelagius]RBP26552.1 virulence factor lipase-like protein [Marinobacter pelagius]